MQFSITTSTFFALLLASISSSSPIQSRDVASCEVAAAAEHVKCIEEAKNNPAAITACTAVAVGSYNGCAGVAARHLTLQSLDGIRRGGLCRSSADGC